MNAFLREPPTCGVVALTTVAGLAVYKRTHEMVPSLRSDVEPCRGRALRLTPPSQVLFLLALTVRVCALIKRERRSYSIVTGKTGRSATDASARSRVARGTQSRCARSSPRIFASQLASRRKFPRAISCGTISPSIVSSGKLLTFSTRPRKVTARRRSQAFRFLVARPKRIRAH